MRKLIFLLCLLSSTFVSSEDGGKAQIKFKRNSLEFLGPGSEENGQYYIIKAKEYCDKGIGNSCEIFLDHTIFHPDYFILDLNRYYLRSLFKVRKDTYQGIEIFKAKKYLWYAVKAKFYYFSDMAFSILLQENLLDGYDCNNYALSLRDRGRDEEALAYFTFSCGADNKYGCLNLAIIEAENGYREDAYKFLRLAFSFGYDHFKWLEIHPRAKPLRDLELINFD